MVYCPFIYYVHGVMILFTGGGGGVTGYKPKNYSSCHIISMHCYIVYCPTMFLQSYYTTFTAVSVFLFTGGGGGAKHRF